MSFAPPRRAAIVALCCPSCAGGLDPLPDDRIYFCSACGRACELEGRTLVPRDLLLLGDTANPALLFLPFWVLGGEPEPGDGPDPPASGGARVVPAVNSSRLLTLTRWYTERASALGPAATRAGRGLWGGSLGSEDARRIERLSALHAERRGRHSPVARASRGTAPSLAALPFARESRRLVCALTGLHVYFETLPAAPAILERWSRH